MEFKIIKAVVHCCFSLRYERRGALAVSALNSESSGSSSSSGRGHRAVFLGRTLNFHGTLRWTSIPSRGGGGGGRNTPGDFILLNPG